jgi:hypothetical protein
VLELIVLGKVPGTEVYLSFNFIGPILLSLAIISAYRYHKLSHATATNDSSAPPLKPKSRA